MKSIIIHLICASLLIGVVVSCSKSTSPTEKTLYTCSMHPQVVQDHPGDCPICGMKLVQMRRQSPSVSGNAKSADATNRKIKYYKSTMLLGEISQTPRKDSMGMDMAPVYEEEAGDSSTILIDPLTVQ